MRRRFTIPVHLIEMVGDPIDFPGRIVDRDARTFRRRLRLFGRDPGALSRGLRTFGFRISGLCLSDGGVGLCARGAASRRDRGETQHQNSGRQ